jgi:hypothetical protein
MSVLANHIGGFCAQQSWAVKKEKENLVSQHL